MGKGGSTVTNTTTYTASPQEQRLMEISGNYAEQVMPNAYKLNNIAGDLLYGSYGTVQADYDKMNSNAQKNIVNAQNGLNQLSTGVLPTAFTENMMETMQNVANKSIGANLNSLAQRGVVNSSVANRALDDVSQNISDTMANQYNTNLQTLGNIYNGQIQNASVPISVSAAAQEAAQQPALSLWNASLGLNGATTSALGAISGKVGTSSATSTKSGGGGLFSALFG